MTRTFTLTKNALDRYVKESPTGQVLCCRCDEILKVDDLIIVNYFTVRGKNPKKSGTVKSHTRGGHHVNSYSRENGGKKRRRRVFYHKRCWQEMFF